MMPYSMHCIWKLDNHLVVATVYCSWALFHWTRHLFNMAVVCACYVTFRLYWSIPFRWEILLCENMNLASGASNSHIITTNCPLKIEHVLHKPLMQKRGQLCYKFRYNDYEFMSVLEKWNIGKIVNARSQSC